MRKRKRKCKQKKVDGRDDAGADEEKQSFVQQMKQWLQQQALWLHMAVYAVAAILVICIVIQIVNVMKKWCGDPVTSIEHHRMHYDEDGNLLHGEGSVTSHGQTSRFEGSSEAD